MPSPKAVAQDDPVADAHRPSSIGDFLAVLREQRLFIGFAVLAAVMVSLAISLSQDARYRASASIQFGDLSNDFALVGTSSANTELPAARALRASQTLLNADVLNEALDELASLKLTVADLRAAITATPENASNLVVVTATAPESRQAARIANAVAAAAAASDTRLARQRFSAGARELRKQFAALPSRDRADSAARNVYNDRISRLEALAAVASPARIAEQAEPPADAASPQPVRSGLIASFLGLLIGVGIAFVRNSLDRRVRSAEEVESYLGLPLLGHVRSEAMGKAGLAAAKRPPLADIDVEGFRILRANLDFLVPDQNLQVTLVTSGLPEEGKSTVAASLAFASVLAGRRTLLIECDLRRPSLAGRLGLAPSPGLMEFLADEAQPDEIVRTIQFPIQSNNGEHSASPSATFACILAGRASKQAAEVLGTERFRAALTEMRSAYDVIIIDSAPLLPVVDSLELLPLVDAIVLCVRDRRTTLDQAESARDILTNVPDCPVALVVTGIDRGRGLGYGYYGQSYAYASP